jgi:ribosomal protein S18 acetylase RimI-like enzyme
VTNPALKDLTIRTPQPNDRNAIEHMLTQSGFFTQDEVRVALELFDVAVNNPDQQDYLFALAELNARVVGYVCYGWNSMTEGTWDVYWICVNPDEKNLGIGKVLMAHTEQEIWAKKGLLIVVETSGREQYQATRAFYLKLGYQEEARLRDFYRPGDDRVIYTKRFPTA